MKASIKGDANFQGSSNFGTNQDHPNTWCEYRIHHGHIRNCVAQYGEISAFVFSFVSFLLFHFVLFLTVIKISDAWADLKACWLKRPTMVGARKYLSGVSIMKTFS
jgi:large-conductance mechanosensitive channel